VVFSKVSSDNMAKKRKRKIKWGRVILALLLVISLLFLLGLISFKYFNSKEIIDDDTPIDEVFEEVEDKPQEYSLSLVMVGDALIHDKIYNEALVYGDGNGYDFKPMLSMVKPIVSKYDLAYYNQETILGGSGIGVSSYPSFNSPYEVGDAMIDAGFNLVSLATNHTIDRGEKAVINSRNYWNSKDNVLAVGSYTSFDERNKIQIREVNNITYTMLNYTYGTNGIKVPSGKEYLVNVWPVSGSNPSKDTKYQAYKEQVKKDIESVRNNVDILMVAMHWGVEYQTSPNSYQLDMAEYLASLGVDIIIGTHPHVIQPITWIDDTLVIYSLGNFISTHEVVNMGNRVGLMSSVNVIKTIDDDNVSVKLDNLSNELLYTYYTKNYTDIKVVPFSKMNSSYLSNYKEVYEKYKGIVQDIDKNIYVKPLG